MTENHIYGSGQAGLRLWVYGPFGWVRLPYGADEDSHLKSVNVWDKKRKRWMTPNWWKNVGVRDSLLVKVNQQFWANPAENPNYDEVGAEVGPTPAGYLRLAYMNPRPDPQWRIINLLATVPTHPPSYRLHSSEYSDFGPRGGRLTSGTTHYWDGGDETSSYYVPYWYVGVRYFSDGFPLDMLARASFERYAVSSNGTGGGFIRYPQQGYSQTSGMIDLHAIRMQMLQYFEHSLPDYTGQYDSLNLKHVQRVTVIGTVTFYIQYGGEEARDAGYNLDTDMKNITFSIQSTSNYPGTIIPPDPGGVYDMPFNPRIPYDVNASGTVVLSQTGLPGASAAGYDSYNPNNRTWGFTRQVTLNMQAPGEENVRFTATVDNVPMPGYTSTTRSVEHSFGPDTTVSVPYPYYIRAAVQFTPLQINVHYTLPGVDTPASVNAADYGLGPHSA